MHMEHTSTLSSSVKRLGHAGKVTQHGFRALNEEGFPPEVIERQYAHAARYKVWAAL